MKLKYILLFLVFSACAKYDKVGILNYGNYTDTASTLKSTASFPFGVEVDHVNMETNGVYAAAVTNNFNMVTFGNELKNGSIIQANGTPNYAIADALVSACQTSGLAIVGHNLAWYQQTAFSYYTGLSAAPPAGNAVNILGPADLNYNPDFDDGGSGTTPATLAYWWFGQVGGGGVATFSLDSSPGNVEDGTASLKAVVTTPGSAAYEIQFINQDWQPTQGTNYVITFWAKSLGSGSINTINQTPNAGSPNFAQITVTPTAAWTQYTWNYTAPANSIQFGFQFGTAGTFWIDNVSITVAPPAPPSGPALYASVDSAFKGWITGVVGRYASSIKAWDVLNEPITDAGAFRTGAPDPVHLYYYWGNVLGRGYMDSAFVWAHQANPAADLFMNDYNLESIPVKLDSFIALVDTLKAHGDPITGVGTEMHIAWNTSYAGIDAAFQALAATGLKVRITEMDVKVNTGPSVGFVLNPQNEAFQADMYHYVIQSYLKNVPKPQQYAIEVWGLNDPNSWLYNNGTEFPLLFDSVYAKKPAYAGCIKALKGQ